MSYESLELPEVRTLHVGMVMEYAANTQRDWWIPSFISLGL